MESPKKETPLPPPATPSLPPWEAGAAELVASYMKASESDIAQLKRALTVMQHRRRWRERVLGAGFVLLWVWGHGLGDWCLGLLVRLLNQSQ